MSSPRCWPGFAQSERRRRRCGRGRGGGVVDSGGGDGGGGRIIAAFQGWEREEVLEDRISRCWRTKPKIGMRCPGACRYMPPCTFWCWVLSDPRQSYSGTLVSLNAPCGAGCFLTGRAPGGGQADTQVLMHLLVLGAFCQEKTMSNMDFEMS